jgi:predicted aspartyl protease
VRPYDRNFSPPAPIAEVTITHPVTEASSGVLQGKLDTGADITVIPENLVSKLGLSAKAYLWARGYDGNYSHRPVYYVRLSIEGNDLLAVRCVAAERRNVLIGRNVLNRFLLTLDGRNLCFKLEAAQRL